MGAGSHRALQECWPGFGPSLCQEGPLTVTCQEFSYLQKYKVKLGDHKQYTGRLTSEPCRSAGQALVHHSAKKGP